MPTYFLPPNKVVLPPAHALRRMGITRPSLKRFVTFYRGKAVEVGGKTYQGGYWNEVTPAEITALEAAGYGARLVTVASADDLPAGLDP